MFMGFPIEIKKGCVLGFFCGRTRAIKIRTWNDTNKNLKKAEKFIEEQKDK